MSYHPPDHCQVHPLPSAPQFVGRETELAELRSLWQAGTRGVIALVGLGGAGKTAIAARFLAELCGPGHPLRPDGLFVWSFYQEPDVDYFLRETYRYFARPESSATPAKGAGLLHLLSDALMTGGRHLLVLDGLERVQRQESLKPGVFGQIEDPLLRGLLFRVAEGVGRTVALVTSRFPLTDLGPYLDRGYRHLDIEGLSLPAALALLRQHGVQGDDAALEKLVDSYGAHALTLDHLGGLIGQFLGGDPERAPDAPQFTSPQQDRQALRLARLLNAYEAHLPPAELALLRQLCLLRRSVKPDQILELFLCSPAVQIRTARELETPIQRMSAPQSLPDEFASELANSVRETITDALEQARIAGPEDLFRQSVVLAIEKLLSEHEKEIEDDLEELIRLYGRASSEVPTEERPLSSEDQQRLRPWIARYNELRYHPLLPYKLPPESLTQAFSELGYGPAGVYVFQDMTPADVIQSFRWVKQTLQQFAVKHRALKLVREQCHLYQQKWQASGPLAMLDAGGLTQALRALVDRHLVLREAGDFVSVHPAVRDYFGQSASGAERTFWHHLIGDQLIRLAQRPGQQLPTDQASLDLLEEATFHALQAGQSARALTLYTHVLGGHRHLAWKLGEMARGLRIVRGFSPCPDRWALGWYLRALGELEAAYDQNHLPYFRADIRLLQGRLSHVEQQGDPARTAIALFLMGQTTQLPAVPLGCVIPRAQILLYLGLAAQAWLSTEPEQVYDMIGWADDLARCQLIRADVACRMGDPAATQLALDQAAAWVLHSGSVEHLCLYHLVRSRIAKRAGEIEAARLAVEEGVHLASRCGLGLYHIELLCAQAELLLDSSQPAAAEPPAREAMRMARAAECQFLWGAGEAGHLLGRSLVAQNRPVEARSILEEVRSIRLRIGDSRLKQTEALLESTRESS